MQLVSLHEKHDIASFLRQNLFTHLFEYSDLDDQYWPYTIWFGLQDGGNLRQVALLYTGLPTPVLMANADRPCEMMADLLRRIVHLLPRRVYAHMHPAHVEAIAAHFAVTPRGLARCIPSLEHRYLQSRCACRVRYPSVRGALPCKLPR